MIRPNCCVALFDDNSICMSSAFVLDSWRTDRLCMMAESKDGTELRLAETNVMNDCCESNQSSVAAAAFVL